jgi:hypothetical protein
MTNDGMEPGIRRRLGRIPEMLESGGIGGVPLGDYFDRVDAEFRQRRRIFDGGEIADTRWNGWRLDPAKMLLRLCADDGWSPYYIDVLTCWHSAGVLDWLVQLSGKNWGPDFDTGKVTVGMLLAVDDILHLQATVCSWGQSLTLNEQQVRDRVACFVQQFHEGEQP